MRNIAIIPVKHHSSRIEGKNYKEFCSHPLFYWVTKAVEDCESIGLTLLATDSHIIEQLHKKYKFKRSIIVDRLPENCLSESTTESVMLEYLRYYHNYDNIILIQATSPMLSANDLMQALHQFQDGGYDSMLSVVLDKRFYWKDNVVCAEPINYNPLKRPRSQDFPGCYIENGSFYITKKQFFLDSKCRISGRIGLYVMPEYSRFEIDTMEDWQIVERLFHK